MSLQTVALASSASNQVQYLRSLPAIRERCTRVHNLAQRGRLEYFDYHPEKESEVIDFCSQIIQVSAYMRHSQSSLLINYDPSQRDFGTDYSKVFLNPCGTICHDAPINSPCASHRYLHIVAGGTLMSADHASNPLSTHGNRPILLHQISKSPNVSSTCSSSRSYSTQELAINGSTPNRELLLPSLGVKV